MFKAIKCLLYKEAYVKLEIEHLTINVMVVSMVLIIKLKIKPEAKD